MYSPQKWARSIVMLGAKLCSTCDIKIPINAQPIRQGQPFCMAQRKMYSPQKWACSIVMLGAKMRSTCKLQFSYAGFKLSLFCLQAVETKMHSQSPTDGHQLHVNEATRDTCNCFSHSWYTARKSCCYKHLIRLNKVIFLPVISIHQAQLYLKGQPACYLKQLTCYWWPHPTRNILVKHFTRTAPLNFNATDSA